MKFHWMVRYENLNQNVYDKLSDDLNDSGYHSVLTTYHSLSTDPVSKAANVLKPHRNLKYMPAIRTYTMSPEYCIMICRSFHEISPNKLAINIVAGDIHDNETTMNDCLFINDLIDTIDKRIEYTKEWLKIFSKYKNEPYYPELFISSKSESGIKNVIEFADSGLAMIDEYMRDANKFKDIKRLTLSCAVVIEDTEELAIEKAKEYYPSGDPSGYAPWVICGTESSVMDKFKEIENLGIDGLMLHIPREHLDVSYRVHGLVKKMVGGGIN